MKSEILSGYIGSTLSTIARRDWVPSILQQNTEEIAWARFFRCYRSCPRCRHDLSTNGRGSFRCPFCGYAEGTAEHGRKEKSSV